MFRHHHRHQFTGNHELCSAFYTNNPLLYVSHYSEIIVATGYEVSRQHDVTAHSDVGSPWRSTSHVGPSSSAARRPESLATRREAVELLSCDAPLLAYLVQNGAISRFDVELIERETASSARQNITLLRCVDRAGGVGLSLLLNALRLTGQHQLANLLDYTPRIVPLLPGVEPTSCTPGFPSSGRHRGQITIEIRVSSVKLKSGGSEWVTLSDIEAHIDMLQQSAAQLRHRPRPSRMFKSPPTPTGLSSRRRYRLQQVSDDRRHSAAQPTTAMFRFMASTAASTRAAPTSTTDAEPDDDRKYNGVLDCLAACLMGKKLYLRQITADNINISSPISKRSQSPTSSVSSMAVGSSSREFQTSGVNCLLAGIELSGGFQMSLTDGAVIRMSKERHDVDIQMSPGPIKQSCHQSSSSIHRPAASDDWQTTPRYQRHLAIARLRRSAELLRTKITQFYDVFSGAGKCTDDLTLRDRLVRYFERSCWLPVLDVVTLTETGGRQAAVAVIVICTTLDQLTALRRHYDIGLLRDDLQHHMLPSIDAADGPPGHVAPSPVPAAQRGRLLGEGDDAIVDAVIDVVIDRDELEIVKTELTQIF